MKNVCVVFSRYCSIINFLSFFYANCNFRSGPNTEIKNSKEHKGVTVVFHAILSEKFGRTEDTHIFTWWTSDISWVGDEFSRGHTCKVSKCAWPDVFIKILANFGTLFNQFVLLLGLPVVARV